MRRTSLPRFTKSHFNKFLLLNADRAEFLSHILRSQRDYVNGRTNLIGWSQVGLLRNAHLHTSDKVMDSNSCALKKNVCLQTTAERKDVTDLQI